MEILYIVIALHVENEQAFTDELTTLFPFACIEFITMDEDSLLVLSVNIDELHDCWINFAAPVLFLDDRVALFSRKHPYLKVGVLNKIGKLQTCFYDGYIMKNKQIVFEHAGLYTGYIPLFKHLLGRYEDEQLALFKSILQDNKYCIS